MKKSSLRKQKESGCHWLEASDAELSEVHFHH